MLAKSERLSACTPPCTIPTSTASAMKSRSVRMKYPSALMPTYATRPRKMAGRVPIRPASQPNR